METAASHRVDGIFAVGFTRTKPRKRRLTARGLYQTACLAPQCPAFASKIFTEGKLG